MKIQLQRFTTAIGKSRKNGRASSSIEDPFGPTMTCAELLKENYELKMNYSGLPVIWKWLYLEGNLRDGRR